MNRSRSPAKSSGFTLPELVVYLGIVSIMSLALSNSILMGYRAVNELDANRLVALHFEEMQMRFRNPEFCRLNLAAYAYDIHNPDFTGAGININIAEITNSAKDSSKVIAPGLSGGGLSIESVQFHHVRYLDPVQNSAEVILNYKLPAGINGQAKIIKKKISLDLAVDRTRTTQIDHCHGNNNLDLNSASSTTTDICNLMYMSFAGSLGYYDTSRDGCNAVRYEYLWIRGDKYEARCSDIFPDPYTCRAPVSRDVCPPGAVCSVVREVTGSSAPQSRCGLSGFGGPKPVGAKCEWALGAEGFCDVQCRRAVY